MSENEKKSMTCREIKEQIINKALSDKKKKNSRPAAGTALKRGIHKLPVYRGSARIDGAKFAYL